MNYFNIWVQVFLLILQTFRALVDTSDRVTFKYLLLMSNDIPIQPEPEHKSITFFWSFISRLSLIDQSTSSSVSGLGIKTFSST